MSSGSHQSIRKLILLRHGESQWNRENRFSGWTDVDLTERGRHEARDAAEALKRSGIQFEVAFTSVLTRAIRSLWILLDELDQMWVPVHRDWRLNERHYGSLQGLNKAETADQYGAGTVQTWRRSYDIRPPALDENDLRHPRFDPRYRHLTRDLLPTTESLRDTVARLLPCWHESIAPLVRYGRPVLIVAHGNSLRALVKYLDGVSDREIVELNIPTGVPLIYELDEELRPVRRYYIGKGAHTPWPVPSSVDRMTM